MTRRNSAKGKIIGAIVVIVIVAAAAWWYFTRMPGVDFSRRGPEPSGPAKASTAPPPIEHPISEAQTSPAPATTTPLPPLDTSDDTVASALASIPGADGLAGLLLSRGLIPHIVATVDALPRHTIGASILPLRTPKGTFTVDTSSGKPMLDSKDFTRYDPYMQIAQAVDPRTLVTWYVHWYPLFQQAYRELGYPQGYFNDRLIAAIDDMLAAPNAQPPAGRHPGRALRVRRSDLGIVVGGPETDDPHRPRERARVEGQAAQHPCAAAGSGAGVPHGRGNAAGGAFVLSLSDFCPSFRRESGKTAGSRGSPTAQKRSTVWPSAAPSGPKGYSSMRPPRSRDSAINVVARVP